MSGPNPQDIAPEEISYQEFQTLRCAMWEHIREAHARLSEAHISGKRLGYALGIAHGLYLALGDPQEEALRRSATAGDMDGIGTALAHTVALYQQAGLSEEGVAISMAALSERIEASEDLESSAAKLEDAWLLSLASIVASICLRRLNGRRDVQL